MITTIVVLRFAIAALSLLNLEWRHRCRQLEANNSGLGIENYHLNQQLQLRKDAILNWGKPKPIETLNRNLWRTKNDG